MSLHLLEALTSIRVGDGGQIGAIDLPLARESHTCWPAIPGSSLKGALRAHARGLLPRCKAQDDAIAYVFGDPAPNADDPSTAGSVPARGRLTVGGATLLALPVRSLRGGHLLLTCPLALARVAREHGASPAIPAVTRSIHLPTGATERFRVDHTLRGTDQAFAVVEDLSIPLTDSPEVDAWATQIAQWTGDDTSRRHLAVGPDELFDHAVRAWTETRTRNAIDPDTGVVRDGLLFSVEMLPASTLLWTHLRWSAEDDEGDKIASQLPRPGTGWCLGGHTNTGLGHVTLHRVGTP